MFFFFPKTQKNLAIIETHWFGFSFTELIRSLTEKFDEAAVTVGFVVLLFEGAFVELLQAEGADKVLRVELLGHGCDAASCDGLLAAGAEGAAPLVVVHFTVGLAVVLEETSVHKWREALLQTQTHKLSLQSNLVGATGGAFRYLLCKQNTRDARGSSAPRCNFPEWLWHSRRILEQTCQSNPSCNKLFHPFHENLQK